MPVVAADSMAELVRSDRPRSRTRPIAAQPGPSGSAAGKRNAHRRRSGRGRYVTSVLREVEVAGIATTPFGNHLDRSLGSLAAEAVAAALADAGLEPGEVESAVFSNAAAGVLSGQEMIRGQVALKGTGLAGVPIFNTENACASGSSAAHLA